MDTNADQIRERLTRLVNELAKLFPDSTKASADLWKFAKLHDRRNYQLIRFCMAPESDFRTMYKAQKELIKRIESNSTSVALQETLMPLLYRSSIAIYNKSHVSGIMDFTKTGQSLAPIAFEVLKDISARTPDVLKAHVQEICHTLQTEAPTALGSNDTGAVDALKACAVFAKKFPADIPKDRKFTQALIAFAMFGQPPRSAKHAVSILMASSDKKDDQAADLLHKCIKGFRYSGPGFMSRLASLSQLCYLAPSETPVHDEAIENLAIREIVLKNRHPAPESAATEYSWDLEPHPDVQIETEAKTWAIKIAVNRVRSHEGGQDLAHVLDPLYSTLMKLVDPEGELAKPRYAHPAMKPRLRVVAARSILKLCISRPHEALLTPLMFNKLAEVAQDSVFEVRVSFLARLKKYLSENRLTPRFYTIPFLLAFEPEVGFKDATTTWLRSRVAYFRSLQSSSNEKGAVSAKAQTTLEALMARLISLLAHHPDYSVDTKDLLESVTYILYYLNVVANESNISLIYYIAQRVKGCRDGVTPFSSSSSGTISDMSTRLYVLSDLAQLVIHQLIEAHGWALEALPTFTRLTLPKSLFVEIRDKDHAVAMAIAEKSFLPESERDELLRGIETQVRRSLRHTHRSEKELAGRKRKSEVADEHGKKRSKKSMPVRPADHKARHDGKKFKNKKAEDWSGSDENDDDDAAPPRIRSSDADTQANRRKSGRGTVGRSYAERDDDEDDEEMEVGAVYGGTKSTAHDNDDDDDGVEPANGGEEMADFETDAPDAPDDDDKSPPPQPKSKPRASNVSTAETSEKKAAATAKATSKPSASKRQTTTAPDTASAGVRASRRRTAK